MRLLVANFDAEIEMARLACPGPHPGLPRHVRDHLARAARSLTPLLGLKPGRIELRCEGDELDEAALDDVTDVLGWAETPSVTEVRRRIGGLAASVPSVESNWIELLWRHRGPPASTQAGSDRRTWFELADRRGSLLPQTSIVSSVSELRDRLPEVTRHSALDSWIAKAPFGASGRERVHRFGNDFPEDIETRLARLLERYGELILEPRMKRVLDLGVAGIATEKGPKLLPAHQLICNDSGVFSKIDLTAKLDPTFSLKAREAAMEAGALLASRGYLGPFGIDAFVYQTTSGGHALHPMCEINARLTFGHVAHATAGSSLEAL